MSAYKQLTVVSGKGGTGKTCVLASFACIAQNKVVSDTDVDAANLHILLHPEIRESHEFWGAKIAVRDPVKCDKSGECERACRFDAITVDEIDIHACEGCGLCTLVCPNGALRLEPALSGSYFFSETKYGPMAHAKLIPGAESSGRLVTMVRQAAETLAIEGGHNRILIDGPPGIGCTATAAIADVDLALIVTEPTPSGIHDMNRVLGTTAHFGVPATVIVNKADLNLEKSAEIADVAAQYNAEVIGHLPFDQIVTRSVAAAVPVIEYDPDGPVSKGIRECWEKLDAMLDAGPPRSM